MIQNKFLSIVLLLSLAGCDTAVRQNNTELSSSEAPKINLDVKKFTLSNGLRLLVVENHQLPIMSYYTFFDVGGRYEEKGTTGATHFLEHMMFKGAKKYGPGIFDTTIEMNGGSTNAYTTFDSTVYYESLSSSTLEKIVDMEADRMQNLLLEESSFEKERKVVLEERKYRYENSPKGQLYLAMMQAVFEKTPYGGSVIGDEKDVKSLSRAQMRKYFKRFYTPDNAIIVIVGDVDADKTYRMVNDKFGSIPRSDGLAAFKKKMDHPKRFEHKGKYNRSVRLHGESPNPIFMMAFKGEKVGTRRGFVMDILSSILGDGESSYFHQRYVRNKKPTLSSIGVGNYTLRNNGVFYIQGELLDKVGLKSMKRRVVKDLRKVCDKAITLRTVQKTKNQYLVSYYDEIQTNAGIAQFIGMRENFFNDYSFYKNELDIYNSITADEVKKTCRSVFKGNNSIFLSVWKKHKKSKR